MGGELVMFTFQRITELRRAGVLDLFVSTTRMMLKMQLMLWMEENMMAGNCVYSMQDTTDPMNAIVEDVEVVDVTVTEMVAEIEEGTDQGVGIVTEDEIVTGAMTGEGETGVTPEI